MAEKDEKVVEDSKAKGNKKEVEIAKYLFGSQRDFIVIGLCGKTGSGSSTVANILTKSFDELRLPRPNSDGSDLYREHEEKILYTFAEKNWRKFYKIKTSALLMAHILDYDKRALKKFLKSYVDTNTQNRIIANFIIFCNTSQEFDLNEWSKIQSFSSLKANWNKILRDESNKNIFAKKQKNKKNNDKKSNCKFRFYNQEIQYKISGSKLKITNKELYKMYSEYKRQRMAKQPISSPLYLWILKKYIFDFLCTSQGNILWENTQDTCHELPVIAMQLWGINLRISGNPYMENGSDPNDEAHYMILAEEINLVIKLLSAYQHQMLDLIRKKYNIGKLNGDNRQKALIESYNQFKEVTGDHRHTLIVIDSIKNPFESMYLKQRYSNYYLLGIYTEDDERKKRMESDEHHKFTMEGIELIDTIEQLSEFKKSYREHKEKQKIAPQTGTNEKTTSRTDQKDEESKKEEGESKNVYKSMRKYLENVIDNNFLENALAFILQNVSNCLDSADIFINNKSSDTAYLYLKETLMRYVCLIMHPGLVLPTSIERCMQIAYTAKANSGCLSRQVGAVITDKNFHLLSIGWNQQPEGQLPCSYRDVCELCNHWSPDGYSDYENDDHDDFLTKIKEGVKCNFDNSDNMLSQHGRLAYFCFKDIYNRITEEKNQVHTRSLHGEETAFLNLGPTGKELANGGCLFTTSSPCELCSKKAKYYGIAKIYYIEPYYGISHKHILKAGPKEKRPEFILATGAVGRAYMQLYTPLLPLKDEQELWLQNKMESLIVGEKGEFVELNQQPKNEHELQSSEEGGRF